MGAGCYYTLPDNRDIKAYWIEIDPEEYQFELENLEGFFRELPLYFRGNCGRHYYGNHYELTFESTYNGDGILIYLGIDDRDLNSQIYPLVEYNLDRVYRRIMRHLNKYLPLCRATGSYCYTKIEIGSL